MNAKQKAVWIVYLLVFLFIWYVEFDQNQGNAAVGAIVFSIIVAIPAIILHKIFKGKK